MKINKKLSILLVCALIINMFCTTAVLADDAQVSITGAVTEVTIGTQANGKTPAKVVSGAGQNNHSITMDSVGEYAEFTVYSPYEAVYKLSVCYGSLGNVWLSVYVGTEEQRSTEKLVATDNEDSNTWAEIGAVSALKLKEGVNTIRFEKNLLILTLS